MKLKLLILLLAFPILAFSQEKSADQFKAMLDGKTFVFDATNAFGGRGRMIFLDPGYTLSVTPDQIVANLPFFGRAYTSTPGSTDVGLKFELAEFEYVVKDRKKKGWDVTIKSTQSGSDVRSIFLTVQETGNASLRVISNGRDAMSYNGTIR